MNKPFSSYFPSRLSPSAVRTVRSVRTLASDITCAGIAVIVQEHDYCFLELFHVLSFLKRLDVSVTG